MKLFDKNERVLKRYWKRVKKINEINLSNVPFSELILNMEKIKNNITGENIDDYLVDVFAIVREIAKRTIGLRPFDVQLIGGMVLHEGKVAEMKTGEGKTLVATMPIVLNALLKKGVHLVTVNDYLAKRDAMWMGPIYLALGLRVAVINTQNKSYEVVWKNKELFEKAIRENLSVWPEGFAEEFLPDDKKVNTDCFDVELKEITRKEAYECDITYGTNTEFGFDYLRDNLVINLDSRVQRGHFFAIVDEVDSILIDEARTPLVISGPSKTKASDYRRFNQVAKRLKKDVHFTVDEKKKTVVLTDEGIEYVEKLLNIENLYDPEHVNKMYFLLNALKAHHLFKKDVDYIVNNGEVIIVDEFTGRLLPGRRYSGGLHQAIEAKEGVPIKEESLTYATITYQNYFRMYKKLAGMTGTAKTEEEEFKQIYGMEVVVIPTHKPMIRKDRDDLIYRTEEEKFQAVVSEIKKRHEKGQPVLVGTTSIEKSERLSQMLKKENIPHNVLNAKYHEKEAEIVARAGQRGAVTIATNMAGRGTDIKLGPGVKELGGLLIIGTERHESRRIDNQLRGRAGRQGDPGESIFFLSLEDDIIRIFGGEKLEKIMNLVKIEKGEPIYHPMLTKLIERVQKKVESINFAIRKNLLQMDTVLDAQRKAIYSYREYLLSGNLDEHFYDAMEDFIERILEEFCEKEVCDTQKINESLKILNIDEKLPDTREETKKYLKDIILKRYNKKKEELGEDFSKIGKYIALRVLDENWRQYLEEVEHVKEAVSLRAYGQKDPIIEFKKETFRMFDEMMARIYEQSIVYTLNIRKITDEAEKESKKELEKLYVQHDEFSLVNRKERRTAEKKGKKRLKVKR
ncbi:preprotein translocase subunit SecA [Thermosipho melanesiensis]|uniref:Protein translocase subunit SecA n=2 Tax=Thermosipho melanesiensis TaxID=46541 RepID=SECA_THEM4|nr:preprotein translocase subunit SecA [Thermosipho melanesiensis]A6LKK5.1 RecName: Full=Protein translocase subunit SecA [Thermosipho melanesiensis BI429]ABR30456.1 preprotein translocase, SecA subunit [Thermosipho melanesiensis BI429]APT73616.1 preprotein translocase subunit SecA [Thermosipho melanesiensis]OOC37563.1 preprotein translocase subunit SecA [Thermosipho melanesiensis]OOC39459.1 preprotein translocase subunit SecA [Thermosipho melanesiensis]OOC39522.1 preprotein translocase subun